MDDNTKNIVYKLMAVVNTAFDERINSITIVRYNDSYARKDECQRMRKLLNDVLMDLTKK